jgi:Dolichyl-phosphate-mannose-protein mannosyltransferase
MLGLIYLIARRFADRELALRTLATTLAFADWSLKSVEFRPDVLWSCLWFLAVYIVSKEGEQLNIARFFLAGFTLGGALCASIKTAFLLPALALGWLGAWFLCADLRRCLPPKNAGYGAVLAAAGFVMPPAALFGWLSSQGASAEILKFCLFEVNRAAFEPGRILLAPLLGSICPVARLENKTKGCRGNCDRDFLSVSALPVALIGFSPELRKQTLLPAYPLLILFAWQSRPISCVGVCPEPLLRQE